jgi:hypothetical protein
MTDLTAERAILRYTVPADDQWHDLTLPGPIVHVATRIPDAVELWVHADTGQEPQLRMLTVVGTGQTIPAAATAHVGTAVTTDGRLVWHLMEWPNFPTSPPAGEPAP